MNLITRILLKLGKAFIFLSLCLLPLLSIGAGDPGISPTPQAQTKMVEVSEAGLSFELPADMTEVPADGVDSLVRTYESPAIKLLMDYGPYSDSFRNIREGAADLEVKEETIGGKAARIVSYRLDSGTGGHGPEFPYFAGIHFAKLGDDSGFKLTLSASARSPEAQASALRILRSIQFKP